MVYVKYYIINKIETNAKRNQEHSSVLMQLQERSVRNNNKNETILIQLNS